MKQVNTYYSSQSVCGRVRLIAIAFGYGPRVAAENMAKQLNIEIEEWKMGKLNSADKTFKVLLNFGVPETKEEKNAGFKVWIDCLMWLRNTIPDDVKNYDLILAEKFFDTNPLLLKSGLPIHEIPPLISSNNDVIDWEIAYKKEGHILISFGGIETPFTSDVHR